jgi:hypothetical protein
MTEIHDSSPLVCIFISFVVFKIFVFTNIGEDSGVCAGSIEDVVDSGQGQWRKGSREVLTMVWAPVKFSAGNFGSIAA